MGLALLVRVGAWLSIHQTHYADHPLVDAYTYWDQARKLAAGQVAFPEGFYQPPGYPALLAALQSVTGTDSPDVPRVLQLLLGLLTTWLLIRLGRKLGEAQGAPWMGMAAGLIYTLYPTTLLFELDLLTPAVTTACAVGCVALLHGVQAPSGRRSLAAGVLLGLAAVAHPTYLLAGAAVAGWLWWSDSRRILPALAFVGGLVIALAPITTINAVQFKQLSATSNNSGINFYMGNNPGWRETSFLRPGLRFRKLALEAEPHKRDGFERDDYWMSRAWSEIAAAPDAWAAALMTKAYWSVHNTEIPRNEDYRCRTTDGPMAWMAMLPVGYGWVFPLALVGAALVFRRRKGGRLLVGMWIATHLPLVVFIVSDRYRLATWPWLALLAPVGAQALTEMVKQWRGGSRPHWAWLLLLVGVTVPWLPIDSRTSAREGWCAHVAANLAYMEKDMATAEAQYRAALAVDSADLDARNWLARTLMRTQRAEEAIEHVDAILQAFPDHFPTLKLMASLQRKAGNTSAAADHLIRAYRVPGKRTNTGVQAVKALRAAGRHAEASQMMRADPKLSSHPKLK